MKLQLKVNKNRYLHQQINKYQKQKVSVAYVIRLDILVLIFLMKYEKIHMQYL